MLIKKIKILYILIALASSNLLGVEVCEKFSFWEPPFYISDKYRQGDKLYENIRDKAIRGKRKGTLPLRSIVKLSKKSMDYIKNNGGLKKLQQKRKGAYLHIEKVLSVPKNKAFKNLSKKFKGKSDVFDDLGYISPKEDEIPKEGYIHYKSLKDAKDFKFEVTEDSPVFGFKGQFKKGDVIKLSKNSRDQYNYNCCFDSDDLKKFREERKSKTNILDTSSIKYTKAEVDKICERKEPIFEVALNNNSTYEIPLNVDCLDQVDINPFKSETFDLIKSIVKIAENNDYFYEPRRSIASLEGSRKKSLNTQTTKDLSYIDDRGMVGVPFLDVSDDKNKKGDKRLGPFCSYHYGKGHDNYLNSDSACMFMSLLKDHYENFIKSTQQSNRCNFCKNIPVYKIITKRRCKIKEKACLKLEKSCNDSLKNQTRTVTKECCNFIRVRGEQIQWGNLSHPTKEVYGQHSSHRGQCIDIRPLRNFNVNNTGKFGNFWCKVNPGEGKCNGKPGLYPNYDQGLNEEFLQRLKSYKARSVLFNDPYMIQKKLSISSPGHDNHLHFCLGHKKKSTYKLFNCKNACTSESNGSVPCRDTIQNNICNQCF
jgi:hypothetical protein